MDFSPEKGKVPALTPRPARGTMVGGGCMYSNQVPDIELRVYFDTIDGSVVASRMNAEIYVDGVLARIVRIPFPLSQKLDVSELKVIFRSYVYAAINLFKLNM